MFGSYKQILLLFISLTSLAMLICPTLTAQEFGVEEGMSEKELFKMGNYRGALEAYLKLLETKKDNYNYRYKVARCYLEINDDKSLALPILKDLWKEDQSNPEILYDLGLAYHYTYGFDMAINAYNEYKSMIKDPFDIEKADRKIEMCHNGKDMVAYPIDVTFENLGKLINSPYPDFSPCVPNDESFVLFTSRRKGNSGNLLDYDGYYTSDIYMSRVKKGKFAKAGNVSSVNSESDEEAAGVSPDGKNVLVFIDDAFQGIFANIYLAEKKGRSLRPLKSISDFVNTSTSLESSATITSDGQLLYFSSNVDGGFGGMDLYVSRIMPDGSWGVASNLGASINSKYNDEFPSISYDGNTMYFSSDGHKTMGGYDLFMSTRNPEKNTWSLPINLGYPLNTTEDNKNISFSATWDMNTETESNKYAYVAAYREEGYGDLDIYRVTFGDVEERLTAITGSIKEKVLIDYGVKKTFYYYSLEGQKIRIPEGLYPWYDTRWTLDTVKILDVKPGYEYKTMLYFIKEGVQKPFSIRSFPKEDPDWAFVKIRNAEVKIKGYSAPKVLYEELPLPETTIYVTDTKYGEEFTYVASKKGRYIIILPAGQYEIMIDATGYKPKVSTLYIYDKGSYEAEITRDYLFEKDK